MASLKSINPATLEVSGEIETTAPEDVERLIAQCREAQVSWREVPAKMKAERIKALRLLLSTDCDRVAETIHRDTGKPKQECYSTEIMSSVGMAMYCEGLLKKFKFKQKVDQGPMGIMCGILGRKSYIMYQPFGVLGIITSYNFPLAIPFTEIIMAVAAGNGVILKPSSDTPLTGKLIQDLFDGAGFPRNLVVSVAGSGIGTALTSSSVDKIVFTGGTDTGIDVMESSAKTLKPVVLELGGKDPMLILEDADIHRAAKCAVWGSFVNSGQVCVSIKRIYIQRSKFDEFTGMFVDMVKSLKQGDGWNDPDVSVGPMINKKELDRMTQYCDEIVKEGGRFLTGGKVNPELSGYFFEPTVVADLPTDAPIVSREIFGPIVCLFPFDTEGEGLQLANDCPFALAGSVWTSDLKRGESIASRMLSGTVDVNNAVYTYGLPGTPWGGRRVSGIGTTHSEEGFKQLMVPHHVHIDKGKKNDAWWMPYSLEQTQLLQDLSNGFFGDGKGLISAARRFLRAIKR